MLDTSPLGLPPANHVILGWSTDVYVGTFFSCFFLRSHFLPHVDR